MNHPGPEEQWPAIYLQAQCDDCGRFLWSHRYGVSTADDWSFFVAQRRRELDAHRRECPGARLEDLRDVAGLVRMALREGKLDGTLAAALEPILARVGVL